jgi:hypothetical protein
LLSASGVSDDINSTYKELYDADASKTGEQNTYFSRNANGDVLYTTHHFTEDELQKLILSTGCFEIVSFETKMETSSRRPNEAARFFYVVAKRVMPQ